MNPGRQGVYGIEKSVLNCKSLKMEQKKRKPTTTPHLVTMVVPLEGHRNPMLQLSVKMAIMGATVTVVQTDASYRQSLKFNAGIDPILQIREALQIDIRSTHISDGLPLDFDRKIHLEALLEALCSSMITHVETFMESLLLHSCPPVSCLVTDLFFPWGTRTATKFRISHACLNTESAAVFSIYQSWDTLTQHGHLPFPQTKDVQQRVIDYIPGLPPLSIKDLPSYLQEEDVSSEHHRVVKMSYDHITHQQWVFSNTVEELEPQTVSAILASGTRLISVGPLISDQNFNHNSFDDIQDCSSWLDSKSKNSVLYVSFGSLSRCSKDVLHEFAMGLMQSKQPFIWSLRPEILIMQDENPYPGCDEILPREFLEGSKDQGIIVKWCSQQKILGHSSVAGFVTHCGWNSVLESLWYGVPLLCFPLFTDQYTNNWIVVEQWKAGKNLGGIEGRSTNGLRCPVSRMDICRDIQDFMDKERYQVQSRVDWARKVLKNAVADVNSSSSINLGLFLKEHTDDQSKEI